MKIQKVAFLLFCIGMMGLSALMAQEPVTEQQLPDAVKNHFSMNYQDYEDLHWTQKEDSLGSFVYANFKVNGDQRIVTYRNSRYYSTTTLVDLKYLPKSIKAEMDTAYPDYKVKQLSYVITYGKGEYVVDAVKGKKKKAQNIQCFFTPKGEFIRER